MMIDSHLPHHLELFKMIKKFSTTDHALVHIRQGYNVLSSLVNLEHLIVESKLACDSPRVLPDNAHWYIDQWRCRLSHIATSGTSTYGRGWHLMHLGARYSTVQKASCFSINITKNDPPMRVSGNTGVLGGCVLN